jgi:hypothetical protein
VRQSINEAISVASLFIGALSGVVEVWGCPQMTWLHWIPLGFLAVGSALGFVALWQSRWLRPKGYKEIANQEFLNQDVLMDGYLYLACRFTNVTFVYNGGECGGFSGHCSFERSLGFKTGDPKIGQMLGFLKEIGMLRPDAFARYTPNR